MIKDLILDILFPKKCAGCGKESSYVCKKCEMYMLDVPEAIGLTALWEYNGIVKQLIHRIKFNGEYDIIKELVNKKDFDVAENAIITYVPMHIKKQRKRGFNQAEIIAKEISKKLDKPVVKMLEKIKQTKDQASLNKEARLKNPKGCFSAVETRPLKKLRSLIRGRVSVLLVDDVYTSGATMQECSKVLHKAGIEKVWGFVIARTV